MKIGLDVCFFSLSDDLAGFITQQFFGTCIMGLVNMLKVGKVYKPVAGC